MKRNIIRSITASAAAALLLLLNSCVDLNMKSIVGSGNVKTETRTINGEFNAIKVDNGLDLVVVQSDQVSVVVEADDNLLPEIKTKLEGKTLVITTDYNSYTNVSSKKVTVKLPKIAKIEAERGSSVNSEGTLTSEDLDLNTSGGSQMNISVESEKLLAESSSGSGIELKGKALEFQTSSSSGSHVTAGDLLANDISADASSGSSIFVHPLVKLKGEASSGGSVRYNNDPKSFSKKESSGGSVARE